MLRLFAVVMTMAVLPALTLRLASDENPSTENFLSCKIPYSEKQVMQQVHKPSKDIYDLWKPKKTSFSQCGQDTRMRKMFVDVPGEKFFLESGAADGETNSNTLEFERKEGWVGLLVEPHPDTFKELQKKNRKSYLYNGMLAATGKDETLILGDCAGYKGDGECSHAKQFNAKPRTVQVSTAPLESLLNCIGRSTIDYWSLDVEGFESKILEPFPFQKVEVGVLMIEMNKTPKNNNEIANVMIAQGFKECGRTCFDRIYVNPAYWAKRGLETPKKC